MAKKANAMTASDTMDTAPWEPSDTLQLTPSPIRQLDFGTPKDGEALKRGAPLLSDDSSGDEGEDTESAEEESTENDDIVEPIITNHDSEIITIESDDEAILSPKKIGPTEHLADQPSAAHSAEPQQNEPEAASPPLDDSQMDVPMAEASQVFQQVEILADSDDDQAKRNAGTFKASVTKIKRQTCHSFYCTNFLVHVAPCVFQIAL